MADEQTFIYGFRVGHCVNAIFLFLSGAAFDLWRLTEVRGTAARVLIGAVGAFFLYMTVAMVGWLQHRRHGRRRIVVGARALTAPSAMRFSAPMIEIPYAQMRSVHASAGKQGKLVIDSSAGPLEIGRMMLGTDAEFDKLTTLVQQRAAAARK